MLKIARQLKDLSKKPFQRKIRRCSDFNEKLYDGALFSF